MEMQRRLDGWKFKLEETKKKYIKLAVPSCKPKRGKRVKMSKDETWLQLADYTAEVVFEFLLKVNKYNMLYNVTSRWSCNIYAISLVLTTESQLCLHVILKAFLGVLQGTTNKHYLLEVSLV